MGSWQALGQMTSLGQTLFQAQSQTQGPPQATPPQMPTQEAAEPPAPNTGALSDALVRILSGTPGGSAPSATTPAPSPNHDQHRQLVVDQLRAASGSSPSLQPPNVPSSSGVGIRPSDFESLLAASPHFSALNNRVGGIEAEQQKQAQYMETIAKQQTCDSSTLSEILNAVRNGNGSGTTPDAPGPRSPSGAPGSNFRASQNVGSPTPPLERVPYDIHVAFCNKYSVSIAREFLQFAEFDTDVKTDVIWERWCGQVGRCKCLSQWQKKLEALGFDSEETANLLDTKGAVEYIARRDPGVFKP